MFHNPNEIYYCCDELKKSQCVDEYKCKWFIESEFMPTEYIKFCPFCGKKLPIIPIPV